MHCFSLCCHCSYQCQWTIYGPGHRENRKRQKKKQVIGFFFLKLTLSFRSWGSCSLSQKQKASPGALCLHYHALSRFTSKLSSCVGARANREENKKFRSHRLLRIWSSSSYLLSILKYIPHAFWLDLITVFHGKSGGHMWTPYYLNRILRKFLMFSSRIKKIKGLKK